jgi:DNA-binding response OmpR family regulator
MEHWSEESLTKAAEEGKLTVLELRILERLLRYRAEVERLREALQAVWDAGDLDGDLATRVQAILFPSPGSEA